MTPDAAVFTVTRSVSKTLAAVRILGMSTDDILFTPFRKLLTLDVNAVTYVPLARLLIANATEELAMDET